MFRTKKRGDFYIIHSPEYFHYMLSPAVISSVIRYDADTFALEQMPVRVDIVQTGFNRSFAAQSQHYENQYCGYFCQSHLVPFFCQAVFFCLANPYYTLELSKDNLSLKANFMCNETQDNN